MVSAQPHDMNVSYAGNTHIGRRSNNEDALCTAPELGLFVVADGMGGYEGGEIASSVAVASLRDFIERNKRDPEGTWPNRALSGMSYDENLLVAAVVAAHREIITRRSGPLDRMGSTVVAAMISGTRLIIAHVGDSRLYRLRGARLEALTRDHSYWAEIVAAGSVVDRASFSWKNQITRALGIDGASSPDVATHELEPGDALLLCSDGLYDPLDDPHLSAALGLPDPHAACERLVQSAYEAGGTDNITAIVLRAA